MKVFLTAIFLSFVILTSANLLIAMPGGINSSEISNATQSNSKDKQTKKNPLIGVYDVQIGLGAITNGEMGLDFDIGATLVNISYGKNDASTTMEVHYDYAHEKFDNTVSYMHFKRNNIYVRFRPFTTSPTSETNLNNLLGVLISGLYADVGYSKGHYFYKDLYDNRLEPDYQSNGMFWGWGYNLFWRDETRWGATIGFGSKRYRVNLPNGTTNLYKIRTISLGVTYNLIWQHNN